MPQSQTFTTDTKKTLASFIKDKNQGIPSLDNIGNQQIPKKLIDQLLKKQTKPKSTKTKVETKPLTKSSSNNEDISKEDDIMKIINYQNSHRFGNHLKKDLKIQYTRDQLQKKSLNQLEAILHRIRTYLNTRHMEGVYEQMVKTCSMGVVTNFGYDIEGFSSLLLNNPAFWDAFEMWKLERKLPNIPPSLQLMYIISSTTIIAHMQNKHKIVSKESRIDQKKDKKEKTKQVQEKQKKSEPKKTLLKVGTVL